jgi:TM2 domain-containing membrane protein YozV
VCTKCGTRLKGAAPAGAPPTGASYSPVAVGGISTKTRLVAALLCFFLGTFGAHRFYTGKTGSAVGQLLISVFGYIFQAIGLAVGAFAVIGTIMISAVGVWVLIDFIFILIGKFKDKNGLLISLWSK